MKRHEIGGYAELNFEMADLGLNRELARLASHNPRWKDLFEEEKRNLLERCGDSILEVSHGGSTAIPGILAKPIIDIFTAVISLRIAEELWPKLELLGYEYRGEQGFPERRFYAKGERSNRTHHLHLVENDSHQWRFHRQFRDYCINHPESALQYSLLKQDLAARFPADRKSYGEGKDEFIRDIIAKAEAEERSDPS